MCYFSLSKISYPENVFRNIIGLFKVKNLSRIKNNPPSPWNSYDCEPMPATFATIKSASTWHVHHDTMHKAAPIPAQPGQEKVKVHQEKQHTIDDAVSKWFSYTMAK